MADDKSSTISRYLGKGKGKPRSEVDDLRDEIALLTSYSTDTIYRLRYDTMQYDYISPSVERLLGYTQDEIRRMKVIRSR